jgi:hypothetical protein
MTVMKLSKAQKKEFIYMHYWLDAKPQSNTIRLHTNYDMDKIEISALHSGVPTSIASVLGTYEHLGWHFGVSLLLFLRLPLSFLRSFSSFQDTGITSNVFGVIHFFGGFYKHGTDMIPWSSGGNMVLYTPWGWTYCFWILDVLGDIFWFLDSDLEGAHD